MDRSSWKSTLRLGLLSVPVKAYTSAIAGGGRIELNQLHKGCNCRIKYLRQCPEHGPVDGDEIDRGYEHAKGQYVIIQDSEIDALRSADERNVTLRAILPAGSVAPQYFAGQNYYLIPDGEISRRNYAIVRRLLGADEAIVTAVILKREKIGVLRVEPSGVLCLHLLEYAARIKESSRFSGDVPDYEFTEEELAVGGALADRIRRPEISLADYPDTYYDRLAEVIEAKVAGGVALAASPSEPAQQCVNLLETLRASVEASVSAAADTPASTPKRRRRAFVASTNGGLFSE